MMKKFLFVCFAVTGLPMTACILPSSPEPTPECMDDPSCVPAKNAILKATYTSGHLGSYSSCPDKGYREQASKPASSDALPEGDCAENVPNCFAPLNCDDAQVTIRLTNSSKNTGKNVQVREILLLDSTGMVRATLSIINTMDATTNKPFDNVLDPGETRDLRIIFEGPNNPYQLLADPLADEDGRFARPGGKLKLTIGADNADNILLTTGEVYALPQVDT